MSKFPSQDEVDALLRGPNASHHDTGRVPLDDIDEFLRELRANDGSGDDAYRCMWLDTFADLERHLLHARHKHPWPADMPAAEKYRVIERELHEMGVCMLKGDARGVRKEALDCVAVLIRVIEGSDESEK